MSDMWQVPEGLAESLLKVDPCADARNDAYHSGVTAGMAYVASMMMDLIKELSDIYNHDYEGDTYHPKNDLGIVIDNAEQRLKRVFDE